MIPLERLTEEAREALARVQQLLFRLRHNQLDAEHLLLALLGEPDGLVKAAFQKLDNFRPQQLLEWLRAELSKRPQAQQQGAAQRDKDAAERALKQQQEDAQRQQEAEEFLRKAQVAAEKYLQYTPPGSCERRDDLTRILDVTFSQRLASPYNYGPHPTWGQDAEIRWCKECRQDLGIDIWQLYQWRERG